MSCQSQRPLATGLFFMAALALVAAMASGARANWKIDGVELKANESFTGFAHKESNLLVPTLNLQILCGEHKVEEGTLLASSGTLKGKIVLSKCKTWTGGKEIPVCKPIEPITAKATGHLILHKGSTYILVESSEGLFGAFTIVKFGGECALPEENEVRGSFIFECLTKELKAGPKLCEIEEGTHLMQVMTSATLITEIFKDLKKEEEEKGVKEPKAKEDLLTFGVHPVVLDGVAALELSGANKGKKWSGSI
jgi:hypothetical protein